MTSLRYREYTLLCDHPDCTEAYGPFGVERTEAQLRRLAAEDGWTHVRRSAYSPPRKRDKDFCPAHESAGTLR